jgi:hypothetical protein
MAGSCQGAPCPQESMLLGVRWSVASPLRTRHKVGLTALGLPTLAASPWHNPSHEESSPCILSHSPLCPASVLPPSSPSSLVTPQFQPHRLPPTRVPTRNLEDVARRDGVAQDDAIGAGGAP